MHAHMCECGCTCVNVHMHTHVCTCILRAALDGATVEDLLGGGAVGLLRHTYSLAIALALLNLDRVGD